jgi:FkbM family methyltransferase
MICYTRNFEDVILQRVLADVSIGTYIDVGASKPIKDSNTYALYQKGWRGVAIEPLPYRQHWMEARPEDVLLSAAVGAQAGTLTLQVYDQAQQISTGSPDTYAYWKQKGVHPTRRFDVPMLTLNQVIVEHLPDRALHLLSIDVEGMETEVIKSLDLSVHRPWVIIVEATLPGSRTRTHQMWEAYLLDAGYVMTYFDGANCFFLAPEQSHLLERFDLPPNVWDKFLMAKDLESAATIKQLREQVAELEARLLTLSPIA